MKPMLASKWEERNEDMFPFWVQPKLDGIRILIGEDGYAYTRSLKPIRNNELQSLIRHHKDELAGLDGEIIVGDATAEDCYRRTSSAVMSFDNDDIAYATIQVFDIWNDPFSSYDDRYGSLIERSANWPNWVQLVTTTMVHDMDMLNEYEAKRLEEGHEGLILRKGDRLYKQGRGTPKNGELIKLKQFEDTEGKIVAVHELMHNANPATINALGYTEHSGHQENLVPMGTLGAIEVELGPEWQSQTVRIGTGFTEEMRKQMWTNQHLLKGQFAKYKFFRVGTKDAPRFPVFLGLRDGDDMEPAQGSLF